MTKQELVNKIAEDANISKRAAEDALKAFISAVKESLAKGESVSLVGFGTFTVSERAARKGRNPQTGAEIQIPARKVPVFRAGKGLKEAL
ncbi:HU family DNA-binding protein [Caldithrix abyssi]|uniref:DNA-binding protein HU-beta n=1 Tax=Caldithrix abyssi DSM 13497 TaxID=880073 RepID=H1XV34_CALAY|nr:HU family DNA-binding protein [Caldithrix abyssi]APF18906.1 DNA-binding protein HU-beta [Caldithrix abyssi DSM 13497]EHO42867.1 histone family protein DNA-binding protein [Caldithrix abyssi DSM 13497]